MAVRAAVCSGLVLAGLQVAAAGDVDKVFQQWLNTMNKEYESEAERFQRFQIFEQNLKFIQEENAKGHSYKLGLNEFADMSKKEFAATHLGLKTEKPFAGLKYLGRHERRNVELPTSVDWRQKGAVTGVKNQGQCGSCWAFSSTGALEGAWEVATGKLVSLSEQQFVDCSGSFGNQGCNGGLMDNAFQYAEKNALCTESSYAYTAQGGTCHASGCTVGIPAGSVTGYKDVAADDIQALMDAVAQQPVSVAIEADQSAFQLYSGGVLTGTCGTNLDHGVLVVGYGTENGQDYWLVKNSWGASWGESGYVKIAKGKSGAGECGIQAQPSYPVVRAADTVNI